MGITAINKGRKFEDEVELTLKQLGITYEREKTIHGFGKKWRVDFYLPQDNTIIECKNVVGYNLPEYLQYSCLKFLDIRNRFLSMNFVLVFHKPNFRMQAVARFCTKYKIKLTNLNRLNQTLHQKTKTTNRLFSLSRKKQKLLEVLDEGGADGIGYEQLEKEFGCRYLCEILRASELTEFGIITSKTCPRRYFRSSKFYQKSREHRMIKELETRFLDASDYEIAEKHGFSSFQVRKLRLKLRLKKPISWHTKSAEYMKRHPMKAWWLRPIRV